ncbi:MAG: DUF4445 domain-containing protein [bacterium]|nr:DUF4445 domain-containing protein [bacterium]
MNDRVRVELRPLGRSIEVERGTDLRDVLYTHGVEFPCGGRGRCKRCRVQLLEGTLPISEEERAILSDREREEGWRIACRCRVDGPIALQVEQFRAPILVDHRPFTFQPRPGHGVAVDLGTTTLVAQLLDLTTGRVLAAQTALNPQGAFGSDIMSRIQFALSEAGRKQMATMVRDTVEAMVSRALGAAGLEGTPLEMLVLVGNTAMHHLFCGLDVAPLAAVPFESESLGLQEFQANEIGWKLAGNPQIRFLPCLGGFVGSDVLAGALATRMHESDELTALVDLGTNGEIVVGDAQRLLCTSTAAGPAFEAGGIEMGMQATTGAIDGVTISDGILKCRVLGGRGARGICGSGLVDAVAASLDLGWIESSGRLADGRKILPLDGQVNLTQGDVRQLQLAKAAIAAGLKILLERLGAQDGPPPQVNLAGAFGNYVNRDSARRIGLLDYPDDQVEPVGNTALLGAKLALFAPKQETDELSFLSQRIEHVALATDPSFMDVFVDEMRFPD